MLLEIGKSYVTRSGDVVHIFNKICDCTPGDKCKQCWGFPYDGRFEGAWDILGEETFAHDGTCYAEGKNEFDLVKQI